MNKNDDEKLLLPHHVQQELCTTRLPYRQGRKLTAVKVYTINTESNHLLIFGVPSLNLRRELKSHFMKFGKLSLFCTSPKHQSEDFTETYHAVFENIHSARVAKRMMDTKNFYGGSLHVCYAPELESIDETRQKILKRQTDVINRLRNLHKETLNTNKMSNDDSKNNSNIGVTENEIIDYNVKKINMGLNNIININSSEVFPKKRKIKKDCHKKVKYPKTDISHVKAKESDQSGIRSVVEVVDCTSIETEVVTNITEHDKYKMGKEKIVQLPQKPLNKIKFNIVNKKL